MANKYSCVIWLITKLQYMPMSLKQIQEEWQKCPLNDSKLILSERSFFRYKSEAYTMAGVEIVCECRDGSYVYSINNQSDLCKNNATHWVINTMRAVGIVSDLKSRKYIPLEKDAGICLQWMETVNRALVQGMQLKFKFKQYYQNSSEEMIVCPAYIQLFHHRWYLIGAHVTHELPHETIAREKENGTEGSVTDGDKVYIPRYWSLERMDEVMVLDVKNNMPKELRKLLNPETYLIDCYGIMRQWKPILIRIRAFWPQNAYLRDEPLHHTQKLVLETKDYSEYEIYCRPTYDFKQALMWNRDKIAVLGPESFRQDMINILKATLHAYETGNYDQVIDE